MKKTAKKSHILSAALCLCLLLSGCGKPAMPAPELLEPVSANESFRSVERGDVGALSVAYGTIAPEEYAHFWTSSVKVKELRVDIGDYVHTGDVLAVADINYAKEQLAANQDALDLENNVFTLEEKKYEQNRQELVLKQQGEQLLADEEAVKATQVDIDTLDENHRYDTLLHKHNVENISRMIQENQDIIADGTLVARKSGSVTYVRNVAGNPLVEGSDNVVVIADYADTYVKLPSVTVERDVMRYVTDCYTLQNGKKCRLKEYRYSPETYLVAQARGMYPVLRFQFENPSDRGEVGSVVPIFFANNPATDVLRIGNDSLFQDDKGCFVYVQNGDTKELRYIEIGKQDDCYTEVLSGLSEGEKVFYSSQVTLPANPEEFTVTVGNYEPQSSTDFYSVKNSEKQSYYSEYEGQVLSVMKKENDVVSEGDLIATIKVNEGSAQLAEMRLGLENMKKSHEQAQKDFADKIEELEKSKYTESGAEVVPVATETDATPTDAASEEDAPNPKQDAMTDCQISVVKLDAEIEKLRYNYQYGISQAQYDKASCNNDGTGTISLRAGASGNLVDMKLKEGKKVELEAKMFNISIPSKRKLLLQIKKTLTLGTKITFHDEKTGRDYVGTVCGVKGDAENIYVTSMNDRVHLTTSVPDGSPGYYVEFEDESFYDIDSRMMAYYSTVCIPDVVIIPAAAVYLEHSEEAGVSDRFYVWRMVDGMMEKQYVTIASEQTSQDTIDAVYMLREEDTVAVVNGLSAGDVIVRERQENEKENEKETESNE